MAGDHACPVCSATFTRPQHVTRHMRSHTGDRPYKCNTCGDQFARSDLLNRHVNKCHSPASAPSNPPLPASNTHRIGGRRAITRAATSKQACDQCVTSSLACDGANPCNKCILRKVTCTWDKFGRVTKPTGPGHAPPNPTVSQTGGLDWSVDDVAFAPAPVYGGDHQLYGGFSFPPYPPSSSESSHYSHYAHPSQPIPFPYHNHRRHSSTSTGSSSSVPESLSSSVSSSNTHLPLHQEAKMYPEAFGLMSLNGDAFGEPLYCGKSFNYQSHNLKTPRPSARHSDKEPDFFKEYIDSSHPPHSAHPTNSHSNNYALPILTPRRQRSLPSLKTPVPSAQEAADDLKSYEAAVLARTGPINLTLAAPKRRKPPGTITLPVQNATESSLAGALDGESPRGFPPKSPSPSSFAPPAYPPSGRPGFKRIASSTLEPESVKRFHFGNGNGHGNGNGAKYARDGSVETDCSSGRESSLGLEREGSL